MKISRMITSG